MDRLRPRLTYANVLSTICLFLLLGGGAWAAKSGLAPDSVGTRQLRSGAVTGAKVKNGSLTGADIQAGTLRTVPKATSAGTATTAGHATSADNAGHADNASSATHATDADSATRTADATTLDGLGPSAFYAAGGVQRIAADPVYNVPPVTIYSADGLVLTAVCEEGGLVGSTIISIFATATGSGAQVDGWYVAETAGSESSSVVESSLNPTTPVRLWTAGTGGGGSGAVVGTLVYSDAQRAIDLSLQTRVPSSHTCGLSGQATVSG